MSAQVERYLSKLPLERRRALHIVRETIREVAPEAEESLQHRMPTFEVEGDFLAALASQKHYMSLYVDTEALAEHASDLGHLNCGKSCIRFRRVEDLPMKVIKRILQATLAKRANGEGA